MGREQPQPSREPRSPTEQAADAQAMQQFFRTKREENPGRIRWIMEGGEWTAVVPGNEDYERALPERFDRQTGTTILPGESGYNKAAKKLPKRFR